MKKFLFSFLFICSLSAAPSTVFVILAHVQKAEDHALWQRCHTSIRQFYPEAPIVIIDDSSIQPLKGNLENTAFIRSAYPGRGELLPYYYFLKERWADKMIFLHDSMFLQRPFTEEELDHPIKFHWYFKNHEWDENQNIALLLERLNLFEETTSWYGCFGTASIIDLSLLEEVESKYNFTQALLPVVKSRSMRMALERVFAIVMFKERYVTKKECSNFGSIHDYPFAFKELNEKMLKVIQLHYPGAILKTWHGR